MTANSILQTKLHVPQLRTRLVSRPRLIDKLNAEMDGRLILVSASAGSGKTTLITEWLSRSDHRVAWFSLDETDNDPRRFLDYLLAVLRQIQADIGQPVEAMLQSPQPPPKKAIFGEAWAVIVWVDIGITFHTKCITRKFAGNPRIDVSRN
jgi:LuxR family maltose regulon positive regulatory protein